MSVYIRQGPFGLRVGCLGTLILAPLYAAAWVLVAAVYLVILGVKALAELIRHR
jgi:hypothetical protein